MTVEIRCRQHTQLGLRFARLLSTHWGYAYSGSAYAPSLSLLLDLQPLPSEKNHYLNQKQNKGVMI